MSNPLRLDSFIQKHQWIPIFEALSICASLHPGPNLSSDEEMDDAFAFLGPDEPGAGPFELFTGDEGQELGAEGTGFVDDLLVHIDLYIDTTGKFITWVTGRISYTMQTLHHNSTIPP